VIRIDPVRLTLCPQKANGALGVLDVGRPGVSRRQPVIGRSNDEALIEESLTDCIEPAAFALVTRYPAATVQKQYCRGAFRGRREVEVKIQIAAAGPTVGQVEDRRPTWKRGLGPDRSAPITAGEGGQERQRDEPLTYADHHPM
jgi:hypothetical protein